MYVKTSNPPCFHIIAMLFLKKQVSRVLVVCSLSLFYPASQAGNASDFDDYSPDVATLLGEYHAESDNLGSMLPSILSYQGGNTAETLIDFERGLITINGANAKEIKQAAVEILLTQIDPGVIDARTASDLGLINSKTKKPFFYEQVIDQDGLPIASVWRANRFVDHLMSRNGANTRLVIPMTGQHKAIAGDKYIAFAKECVQSSGSFSLQCSRTNANQSRHRGSRLLLDY
jgi:membrane-bound lytic murein transglycosylase C